MTHEITNNVVCATSKASDQPAHTRSLISLYLSLEYSMILKLLTEHHLEFLSLKGGCRDSSKSAHVKYTTLLEITCTDSFKNRKRKVFKILEHLPYCR